MHKFKQGKWQKTLEVGAKSFICWNCNKEIASEKSYKSYNDSGRYYPSSIYLCPFCNAPIIVDDKQKEVLLPLPGKEINKLPENVKNIYEEVRKCMQSNCSTGAAMLMRKIIMNIAVHEGAKENLKFIQYIDFLCDNGIVPKKSKSKANSVKNLGNEANHQIESKTIKEAQNCFEFIELLLKVNYEFADEMGKDEK